MLVKICLLSTNWFYEDMRMAFFLLNTSNFRMHITYTKTFIKKIIVLIATNSLFQHCDATSSCVGEGTVGKQQ